MSIEKLRGDIEAMALKKPGWTAVIQDIGEVFHVLLDEHEAHCDPDDENACLCLPHSTAEEAIQRYGESE